MRSQGIYLEKMTTLYKSNKLPFLSSNRPNGLKTELKIKRRGGQEDDDEEENEQEGGGGGGGGNLTPYCPLFELITLWV